MSGTEPAKKTAATWARAFEELLREGVHTDYRRNREYNGKFIECVRPLDSGLLVSQNCIAKRGFYYHCFALLLTPTCLKGPWLFSPFHAGSRFDNNRVIQDQFFTEFGRAQREGLHSVHGWRKGAVELVTRACETAEGQLLPRYLEELTRGKQRLIRVFELALDQLPEMLSASGRPVRRDVTALDIVRLESFDGGLAEAIVWGYSDDFIHLAGEIPRFLETLHRL